MDRLGFGRLAVAEPLPDTRVLHMPDTRHLERKLANMSPDGYSKNSLTSCIGVFLSS
jgi:hypothetical protein